MRHLTTEERPGHDAADPGRNPPSSWRGAGQQLMAKCGVQIESRGPFADPTLSETGAAPGKPVA